MDKVSGKFTLMLAMAMLLALFSSGPIPGYAVTYWDVDDGDWHDAGNWTAGVPNSTTDAVIDNGGTVGGLSADAEVRNLTVGASNSGNMWYISTKHPLTVYGNLVAGDQDGSHGLVIPFGEIRIKGNLVLGNQAGSQGDWGEGQISSFILTVGQETTPGNLIVGAGGQGSFDMGSSYSTVYGDVIVGDQDGSSGFFSGYDYGSVAITGDFILGKEAGSSGSGHIRFGAITVGQDMVVGGGGSSDLRTGSMVGLGLGLDLTVNGNLIVGDQTDSHGSFGTYDTGDKFHIKGDLILGNQAGSYGHLGHEGDLTVGEEGSPANMIVGAGGEGHLDMGYESRSTVIVHGNLVAGDQAGSTGSIQQYGGQAQVKGNLILGNQAGASGEWSNAEESSLTVGEEGAPANMTVGAGGQGRFEMGCDSGSTVTVHGNLVAGDLAGSVGSVNQYGGQGQVKGDLILGSRAGSFGEWSMWESIEGSLTVGQEDAPSNLIVGAAGQGRFFQDGGKVTVHGNLALGRDAGSQGALELSGENDFPPDYPPQLSASEIVVGQGGQGTFVISNPLSQVNVSRSLTFGEQGNFSAVPGATINMTGAQFANRSTTPSNLSGLANLKLIYTGGLVTEDPFEVAGHDLGPVMAGFSNNFALGTLELGDAAQTGYVGLYDVFDNALGEPGGNEALYVFSLILNAESILDLHDLNLYCRSFTNRGGKILNGTIRVVPLPGSLLFLGTGLLSLGLLGWRRKRG
jgi:hypothetical protein